jgi:LysM repeat protein
LTTVVPAAAQATVHVVQRGDSLSVIAARYGVSLSALAAANGISNNDHVWVGQQLTIPGSDGGTGGRSWGNSSTGATVTVGRGDSLSLIASLHGMTVQALMDLNGLTNPNHVWVGQQLQVSSRAGGGTQAAAAAPASGGGIYHVVQPGDSLSRIAVYHGVSMQSVMDANGLWDPNHVQVGQRLTIRGGQRPAVNDTYAPPAGRKRIVVDLSDQTLTAWQGDTVALYTNVSTGTAATPTVTGYYRIDRKYPSQRMIGPGYDIPDVPSVMYFWQGYAFHGAYWHNNFGTPMSHGCIHLRPGEAQWLYNWAAAGTDVYVNW